MNQKKVILSLFDYSGEWAKPYIDAGYGVVLWDAKVEGCMFKTDIYTHFVQSYNDGENTDWNPANVYGILAAPPCTDFASSGAQWWPKKDGEYIPRCNCKECIESNWESNTEQSITLVAYVMHLVDMFKPKFWVMENPVGRLESMVPEIKPYRNFSFNPSDFGDPYPKKTILWGEFNKPVITAPVLSLFKEEIHNVSPGPKRQELRSNTPKGFAQAFYEANQ